MSPPTLNRVNTGDVEVENLLSSFSDNELDPKLQIEKLRDCIEKRNRKPLLEKITIGSYLSGNASALDIVDDQVGLPPALIEYVVGHMIVAKQSNDINPSYKMLSRAAYRVAEAHIYSKYKDTDPLNWTDDERKQYEIETKLMMREFFTGRNYYWDHPLEAARRAYGPHDEIMLEHLGFTIEDAIKFLEFIEKVLTVSMQVAFERVEKSDIQFYSNDDPFIETMEFLSENGRPPRFSELEDQSRDIQTIEDIHDLMEEKTNKLWLSKRILRQKLPEDCDLDRFNAFLERFTVEIGEWDHPLGHEFREIDDLNPLRVHPFIELGGKILIPHIVVPRRSLMTSFYYDLIQIPGYEGEFGDKWGDYLEKWSDDCLSILFDSDEVMLNPMYVADSGAENEVADLLVFRENTLFVLQCKTAKMNIDTRSGDYEAVKRDLKNGIGHACEQIEGLFPLLTEDGPPLEVYPENQSSDGRNWFLSQENVSEIIPIVVLSEQYDALSTHLFDSVIEEFSFTPYVVEVMSLEIICEALSNEAQFKDYVTKRINQIETESLVSLDEIDYLGAFIDHGKDFLDLPSEQQVQLRDFSHVVGRAIDYKYGP